MLYIDFKVVSILAILCEKKVDSFKTIIFNTFPLIIIIMYFDIYRYL